MRVTHTFDAVWSTWERDKVKPWGHAVSGPALIPSPPILPFRLRTGESFTRELIYPVPNSILARSPRGIGLINPNRNLLSQSVSTPRSQITRPMNLELRTNYTRNFFFVLSTLPPPKSQYRWSGYIYYLRYLFMQSVSRSPDIVLIADSLTNLEIFYFSLAKMSRDLINSELQTIEKEEYFSQIIICWS